MPKGVTVDGYMIHAGVSDILGWSLPQTNVVNQTSRTDTSKTVDGLCPGLPYIFDVAAFNPRSRGPQSLAVEGRTKGMAYTAPQSMNATAVSTSEVHLTWKPPVIMPPRAKYEVAYSESEPTDFSTVTSDTQLRVAGLFVGVYYQFAVRLSTACIGNAPRARASVITRGIDNTTQPRHLAVTATDFTSITIEWQAPWNHPLVAVGYVVKYCELKNQTNKKTVSIPESLSVTLTYTAVNLIPGANYSFSVQVDVAHSLPIAIDSVQTTRSPPPQNLFVEVRDDAIWCLWGPPDLVHTWNTTLNYAVYISSMKHLFPNHSPYVTIPSTELEAAMHNVSLWRIIRGISYRHTSYKFTREDYGAPDVYAVMVSTDKFKGYYGEPTYMQLADMSHVIPDPCVSNPCLHGQCDDGRKEQGYVCQCEDQWEGVDCSIKIEPVPICNATNWISRFGEVSFGDGELNTTTNSTMKCPFNTTNAHQPVARAECVGDNISQARWRPYDNCGPFRNVSELLDEISQVIITANNVGEVTSQVAIVTENTNNITSHDISTVRDIANAIANQNSSDEEVTKSITNIVSNIAMVDREELKAAEENGNSVSDIVKAFETQLEHAGVGEGKPLSIAEENVVVQVRSVPPSGLDGGLVLSVSGDSPSDLSSANITVNMDRGSRYGDDHSSELIAQVSIPPEIPAAIAASRSTSGNHGNRDNETDANILLVVIVHATPSLFVSRSLRNCSRTNAEVNCTANTPVVGLSFGGRVVEKLSHPINLTFTALEPGYTNQACAFWDFTINDWSSRGCTLTSGTAPESNERETYTCSCNHASNFAVLMRVHQSAAEFTHNMLSYIGCAISIVCLIITLATYLWNRKLRSQQTHQIFISLCATLLCLNATFVAILALDTTRGVAEVAPVACGVLAGLVHFFALSSIAWMGVESFHAYRVIVRVFSNYIPNFMFKAALLAWGIPALITLITGDMMKNDYASKDTCFLQLWPWIGGLLIPTAVNLLAIAVVFVLAVRRLMSGKVTSDKQEERRETVERIQNAITIVVLVGLTWITGNLLLIRELSVVAQTLFVVFNSLQGLFIFLLYCMRKPVIREQWGLKCTTCRNQDEVPTRSTGSISGSGSRSSRGTVVSRLWGGPNRQNHEYIDNSSVPLLEPDVPLLDSDVPMLEPDINPPHSDVSTLPFEEQDYP